MQGMKFLRDLKENNDRDWFRERKHRYESDVEQPMAALVIEAGERCRKKGLMLAAKDRNPVMRVYRDIRFSADKRPFKSHVGASLRPVRSKTAQGEIYVHISPSESFVAAGYWMPERHFLRVWREAMTAHPERFLRVVKLLTKADLQLSRENSLTRLPRGYDNYAESEIAELLKLTSFVTTQAISAKERQSAGLVDVVAEFALANKPLLEFGWNLEYVPQRDILDER